MNVHSQIDHRTNIHMLCTSIALFRVNLGEISLCDSRSNGKVYWGNHCWAKYIDCYEVSEYLLLRYGGQIVHLSKARAFLYMGYIKKLILLGIL